MPGMLGNLGPYALVLGVAAVFGLPFLIFSLARQFTGRHMLAFALAMFGVIIAVNLWLANRAVGTFPGLETPNSYVASQQFDRERTAQDALGWTVTASHDDHQLTVIIRDRQGNPARVRHLQAVVGRPTHVREDRDAQFTYDNGVFRAPMALGPGNWLVHLTAEAGDGTMFRQRIDLRVDGT